MKKSILIIEDDSEILECCKLAMESLDYFDLIVTAKSTTEAINKMSNQKFTYCLTDMNLGNKSILDVFDIVLKNIQASKVVIMSGFLEKSTVQFFIEKKIRNILSKPISVDQLIEYFKNLTEKDE